MDLQDILRELNEISRQVYRQEISPQLGIERMEEVIVGIELAIGEED